MQKDLQHCTNRREMLKIESRRNDEDSFIILPVRNGSLVAELFIWETKSYSPNFSHVFDGGSIPFHSIFRREQ